MVKIRDKFRNTVQLLLLQRRTPVCEQQQLHLATQLIQHLQRFFIHIRPTPAFCGEPGRQCFS
ncbi:hypothetical protein D3C81_1889190 [compost metagenome]